ncbi:hypothetical protein [Sphingomonas nostoxanthinifaciens]|uniref:hypothetical protein n=1 Tax=Sphingomonas nostoxanthinifaciens TaxID=2872652 RepID=UPI001CC1FCDE|nr:hypothetical protein [Sphingomonas nostoxanthinifaciens]UAK24336.1 hypothetical protein K8P63_18820 [Sphingomonas nostoxanthinifaciens]
MSAPAWVDATRIGLRLALFLLASMVVLSWGAQGRSTTVLDRYRSLTTAVTAIGIWLFGPAFLPGLFGTPWPPLIGDGIEIMAIATMCAALILLLGTRALKREIGLARVHRGMAVNAAIVMALVAAAWVFR